MPAGATRVVSLLLGKDGGGSTQIAVPPGATGAIVTLTVTDTVDGGYLKLYAGSGDEPATSSINWSSSGQNVAVTASVAVDSTSQVKVTGGVNPTDVVIDVVGYYF